MKGKSIVLQKQNPDRNNRLCDIDDDEDIADKEEITVLFIAQSEESDIDTPATVRNNIWDDESVVMDIPIIYQEPSVTEEISTNINKDNIVATENQNKAADLHVQLNKTELALEESSVATVNISSKHRKKDTKNIPYPAHLPQLTPKLQKILETVGVFNGIKDFVYFWASYLLDVTDNQPTKQDYQNLAMTIVETYPCLKGGNNGCGIVRTQLSTNIRNRRANLKRKLAQVNAAEKSSKRSTNDAIVFQPENSHKIDIDIKTALNKLKEKDQVVDSPHVRRLLQETLSTRRSWIEKEAEEIADIILKFPQLAIYNLIVFEFVTWKKLNLEIIFESIDILIKNLAMYYHVEAITEAGKASIIVKLYEELTHNNMKKRATPLFIVKQMMTSTENLIGIKGDSSRAVLYTAEEGIGSAFIVADTNIRIKIPEPTVAKTIMCLLASYYVWDTTYPLAYANVMGFIDHKVFGTVSKNQRIQKFIRKLNHELKIAQ